MEKIADLFGKPLKSKGNDLEAQDDDEEEDEEEEEEKDEVSIFRSFVFSLKST